ncbi:MAG: DUF4446 family protein [Schaedlerella sp.]|nr:DUF4446 family protein [Schaedlerella sp.]
METGFISSIGINAGNLIIFLILLNIILIFFLIHVNMKCNRLKRSYSVFMRGRDAKSLEKLIEEKFAELEKVTRLVKENERRVYDISRKQKNNYQKKAIVKYDAFGEMQGNISYVLTMLDANNNGWIFDVMHSQEKCYTYLKEVIKGESYVELTEEEQECLERAIFQEAYDIKDVDLK